jgi:hypothetical protein
MPTGATVGPRRGRRVALSLLAIVTLVAGAAAFLVSGGASDEYRRTELVTKAQRAAAPAWTRPCWAVAPWAGYARCIHVRGRVMWVQKQDPDGDGDRHLFVASRFRIHIVKIPKALPGLPTPAIGTRIDATGWEGRGSHGRTELSTLRLTWAGGGAELPRDGREAG